MTYMKDSQGEDIQCEECEMYPAQFEHHNPETDEWTSICVECAKKHDDQENIHAAR